MSTEKLYVKLARKVVSAGKMPMPVSDTVIELMKELITEEQAKFITDVFKKPSLRIDQIKERTEMDDDALSEMLETLMRNGIIVSALSKSADVMVYRLQPPYPGMFEFTFLKKIQYTEHEQKVAKLFQKLIDEQTGITQKNYDVVVPHLKKLIPPFSRIVPVEEEIGEIDVPSEKVIPLEQVSKIIDKFETIGLAYCYCRQEKDLTGKPCKTTNDRHNCFLLGKIAEFAIKYEFAERTSKEKAKEIMRRSEDEGLVHRVVHTHLNPEMNEEAICNCCKCCCGLSQMWIKGMNPLKTLSHYLAHVNEDDCIGCGNCLNLCQVEAIKLINTVAVINQDKCFGCGICAHHCPEEAISLERTELRDVYIPPPRIQQD